MKNPFNGIERRHPKAPKPKHAYQNPFNGIESKDVYTALVGVETRVGIRSMELKVRVYCWAWGWWGYPVNPFNGIERGSSRAPDLAESRKNPFNGVESRVALRTSRSSPPESVQWNWKRKPVYVLGFEALASESVQWNWKTLKGGTYQAYSLETGIRSMELKDESWECERMGFNIRRENPFNGIESLRTASGRGGRGGGEESVQWNWKGRHRSRLHRLCGSLRIRSMELKAVEDTLKKVREDIEKNPFNGIERRLSVP